MPVPFAFRDWNSCASAKLLRWVPGGALETGRKEGFRMKTCRFVG